MQLLINSLQLVINLGKPLVLNPPNPNPPRVIPNTDPSVVERRKRYDMMSADPEYKAMHEKSKNIKTREESQAFHSSPEWQQLEKKMKEKYFTGPLPTVAAQVQAAGQQTTPPRTKEYWDNAVKKARAYKEQLKREGKENPLDVKIREARAKRHRS